MSAYVLASLIWGDHRCAAVNGLCVTPRIRLSNLNEIAPFSPRCASPQLKEGSR
jgi:hypothetical protein